MAESIRARAAARGGGRRKLRVLLFANTDWYIYNFRLALAQALRDSGAEVVLVSPPGAYGPRLQAQGFRWIAVPMKRRSLNPLREALLVRGLVALYRAELLTSRTISRSSASSTARSRRGRRGSLDA